MEQTGPTERKHDFSKGSVKRTMLRLALPMIAAQLVNALYNIVDRIFIGHIPEVGHLALTGVGITFPVILIISAFAVLCGQGGAPLCSIERGKGDNARAERIIGNAFMMLLFFGAVLTVASFLIKRPVLYLFGASSETFSYADQYLTIYLCGTLFVMVNLGMNFYISAQGFAKTAMYTMLLGAVANLVLDPLFIFTFGWGVRGAAFATILSQFLSALWVLRFMTGDKAILNLRRSCMRPDAETVRSIAALGSSGFVMEVTTGAVMIVNNATLQIYGGDLYVGAMTVINSVREILLLLTNGFGKGVQPFLGYNYGAGELGRVREGYRFAVLMCVALSFVTWAAAELFPGTLIRIFNSDEALLAAGIPVLRIYFSMQLIFGFIAAPQHSFISLGKARQAIFFSLLRKVFIVIPLVLLLPGVFGLGVNGVFLAEPISDALTAAACYPAFHLLVYRKLRLREPQ